MHPRPIEQPSFGKSTGKEKILESMQRPVVTRPWPLLGGGHSLIKSPWLPTGSRVEPNADSGSRLSLCFSVAGYGCGFLCQLERRSAAAGMAAAFLGVNASIYMIRSLRLDAWPMLLRCAGRYQVCTAKIEGAPVFPSITLTFMTASILRFEKPLPAWSRSSSI